MIVQALSCNHCGAPLDVPPGAEFATCGHCGSRLAIRRTPTAWYTEVLEQIDQHTRHMEQDLRVVRLQNELELLEQSWQSRRRTLLIRSQNGSFVPTAAGALVGGVVPAVFLTFWIGATASTHAPLPFVAFGVIGLIAAVANAFRVYSRAQAYRDAEADYQRDKTRLVAELQEARGSGPAATSFWKDDP